MIKKKLLEHYSPLYFLAALGAGGIAVTFFIYLTFMVGHPDSAMVTFNDLWPIVTDGHPLAGAMVGSAMLGIAFFSLLHLRLLAWNLLELFRFRSTAAYRELRRSNDDATLMTLPLTLAMAVNVLFVSAVVFIPDLWHSVEVLFQVAIAALLAIGGLALGLYIRHFIRVTGEGRFSFGDNNSLAQMVGVFAFAMIALGLAAPGAIDHQRAINVIGIVAAIFFATIAVGLGLLGFVMGFKSMLSHGIAPAAGPSLWILIPLLALLGIALIPVKFGLAHGFGGPVPEPGLFVLTFSVLSLQILFGIRGYAVMRRLGYFDAFLRGDQRHPGSYALLCPGVAIFVFGMFFIHFGLLKNGLVEPFSPGYFVILAPLAFIQVKTIATLLRLNDRLLSAPAPFLATALPGRQR